jgi:hypothetical protein
VHDLREAAKRSHHDKLARLGVKGHPHASEKAELIADGATPRGANNSTRWLKRGGAARHDDEAEDRALFKKMMRAREGHKVDGKKSGARLDKKARGGRARSRAENAALHVHIVHLHPQAMILHPPQGGPGAPPPGAPTMPPPGMPPGAAMPPGLPPGAIRPGAAGPVGMPPGMPMRAHGGTAPGAQHMYPSEGAGASSGTGRLEQAHWMARHRR